MQRKSLAFRLAVGAGLWIALALAAGGFALSSLFRDYVERSFDTRIHVLMESLVAATRLDDEGRPVVSRALGEPRFEQPLSGWYWQISDAAGPLARSRSLWDTDLPMPGEPAGGTARFRDLRGPSDQALRAVDRAITLPPSDEPLTFTVAADPAEIKSEIARFNAVLSYALAALGFGLITAVLIQVRFGLTPLRRMRDRLAAIRSGRAERLEGEFPAEVTPLADELNALLEHNAQVVDRARTHVGNLAHALKTPLAVLTNEAGDREGDLAEVVRRQTAVMRRQVDHYLVRARTAATGGVLGARTEVAPVVEDLRRTLARIHADRAVVVETAASDPAVFRGERHDLEEMLGNLMDNACKWAAGRVRVEVVQEGTKLTVVVDDDGPGLRPEDRAAALDRGRRLDEGVPGSGLGLSIVADIAGLYGGALSLEDAPLGGLRARLVLPAAAGGASA